MDEAKIDYVKKFLAQFKKAIEANNGSLYVVSRQKNRDSLIILGLTEEIREEIILSLSLQDYCDGPKRDPIWAGDVWEFGRVIEGEEVYIKLKLETICGNERPTCISFHKAQCPLTFPFKMEGNDKGDVK